MKKILIGALFLVVSLLSCVRTNHTITSPDNLNRLLNQTVVVFRETTAGSPICGGVFVSRNQILTSLHCVSLRTSISISTASEGEQTFLVNLPGSAVNEVFHITNRTQYISDSSLGTFSDFRVVSADEERDLALLQALDLDYVAPSIARVYSSGLPRIGENVVVIGHPLVQMYNVTSGIISGDAWLSPSGVIYLRASTPIYFGNSGGPLFNEDGLVLGITHATIGEVTHLGHFTSYLDIGEFLSE